MYVVYFKFITDFYIIYIIYTNYIIAENIVDYSGEYRRLQISRSHASSVEHVCET